MMQDIWIVDAFASVPFTGNAAAVRVVDTFPDDADMQKTAFQMQLSETAFVVPEGNRHFNLRWFTPEVEVDLCGHATLAAAHVLRQSGMITTGDTATFRTRSGDLKARMLERTIELDFPTLAGTQCKPPAALDALGVDILACEKNRDNYLVEVKNFDVLTACKPNFKKLLKLEAQGVIVTTAGDVPPGFDFASRYFAPRVGVDEDPVCGSAHCFLGPYWAKKLGKNKFHAYQASKGMGVLDVTVNGERTLIGGRSFTTLRGAACAVKPKEIAC